MGRRALFRVADVRDERAVSRVAEEAREAMGPINVLVNNAAARPEKPFQDLSAEELREVVGMTLDGAFVCSRAVLPGMVVAAKAGLIGFTKALALEYAAAGITVSAVSPGLVDTAREGAEPGTTADRASRSDGARDRMRSLR